MASEDRALQEAPQPEAASAPSSDHNDNTTQQSSSQPQTNPSSSSPDGGATNNHDEQQSSSSSQPPQQDPDATASPPLPNRHTATTPGPRAQRFSEMFDLALNHTLTKISLDNFASCYPTIASQAPHILKQVQRGMVDRLAQLCNQEFAAVLARYQVVPKLNELESLVSDAEQRRRRSHRHPLQPAPTGKTAAAAAAVAAADSASSPEEPPKPTPPHLLPASVVLAAHLAPHLAGQQSQMNARLQNTQAANATLWEAVQAQRREVAELLGALEAALQDVDGAAALMDGVPAEELAKESRTVEAEMADV